MKIKSHYQKQRALGGEGNGTRQMTPLDANYPADTPPFQ